MKSRNFRNLDLALSPQGSVRVFVGLDRRGLDGVSILGEGLREAVAFEGGLLAIVAATEPERNLPAKVSVARFLIGLHLANALANAVAPAFW